MTIPSMMRHHPRRREAARGSIYVEMMVVFPIFASLWLLAIYAFGYFTEVTGNLRHVRRCAWAYASSGCRTMPPGCDERDRGRVADGELRAAAQGGFERIASRLRFLAPTLTSLHGDRFSISRTRVVARPTPFGGQVSTTAAYHTMCNTKRGEWRTAAVFALTCRSLGAFCQ